VYREKQEDVGMRFFMAILVLSVGCTDGAGDVDLDGDGVNESEDCDDGNANAYPGNTEVCDGIDNDCDGMVDNDASDPVTWYTDADSDGYGDGQSPIDACTLPAGAAANGDDCDDTDWLVNPAAVEVCDLLDNDCNDVIDDAADEDGDGVGACDDCDDTDANIYKGNEELCDEVDNDCDGEVDEYATGLETFYADADGDGYGDPDASVEACTQPTDYVTSDDDCDDDDPTSYPDAPEVCDGADNDCNLVIDDGNDLDSDSFDDVCGEDCNDDNADINPGADELCDGIDNNCSGTADDDALDSSQYFADSDGDSFGDALTSVYACDQPTDYVLDDQDCNDGESAINPDATETCDGVDEDCDVDVDEGLFSTYYTDSDGDGFGDPDLSTEVCSDPGTGYATNDNDCDDDDGSINPDGTEVCDGIDQDCDDDADEGLPSVTYYTDSDGDGYGDPDDSTSACTDPGTGYATNDEDCNDSTSDISPDASETCDGIDEDCDDSTDEGLSTTTYYTDADGDGYGEDGSDTDSCSDPGTGYATVDGDCDDDDSAVSPDETEICNDWLDNDCDGTDNGCTPTGQVDLIDADAVIVPDSSGTNGSSQMGWRVAGGGDVNEDGLDDVICGARRDASGGGQGAAWVYTEPNGLLAASDAYGQLVSSTGSEEFGNGVAMGDLNGDGVADMVVGAPGTNTVQIWFGPLSSATASYDALVSGASGTSFGTAIAVGDVDGDGILDLVVGALGYSSSSLSGNGAAYVFTGPIVGDLSDADAYAVLEGEVGGDQAGGEVAIGGDLLGTGNNTVIVGAKGNDTNGGDSGAVYLVDGSTNGTLSLTSADAIFYGATGGDDLWDGHDAGDLDDDGSPDLVLGASDDETSGSASGSAGVFFGPLSGANSFADADLIITGRASADKFGYAADAAGDFNGDGYDDLIVGAYGDESPAHNSGSAYIFFGPLTAGTLEAASADLQLGGTEDDQAGLSVAGAFDVNGDGYDDVIVGSWKDAFSYTDGGACYVVYGGGI
jgi:hypothetical protein